MTLEELATFPIITFSRNTQPYMAVRTLFSRHDLPPVRLHASASLSTVVHMATEGLGIAVIPAAIVSGELASGRLAVIETNTHIPDLPFYAAWTSTPDSSAPGRSSRSPPSSPRNAAACEQRLIRLKAEQALPVHGQASPRGVVP